MPTPGDYELVLPPTKVLTEGTGTSHAPYIVATDLTSGTSLTAWTDNDDASYGKCDASRSSRGNYPLWSAVDPSIDPTWVTAIGVRFRALTPSTDPVTYFVVNLFGQTSKLLSTPSIGGELPLVPGPADTWVDFDYVVADADYDAAGWAPDGVQSALEQTFIYCRTVPSDATGVSSGSGVLQISEQSIVIYYTVPDTGTIDLPCDTDVALDLSTAVFTGLGDPGGPFGQYGDGVIYTANFPGFPDFYFGLEDLDPTKRYRVTVTYDPASGHDAGGRGWSITGVQPGHEDDPNTITFPIGDLYDASGNTADSLTVTIGPGINGWDDGTYGVAAGFTRLWFETHRDGAVSAITVRKVCKTSVPPLRLTNRDDQFSSAPRLAGRRSRQGSARITGYL